MENYKDTYKSKEDSIMNFQVPFNQFQELPVYGLGMIKPRIWTVIYVLRDNTFNFLCKRTVSFTLFLGYHLNF